VIELSPRILRVAAWSLLLSSAGLVAHPARASRRSPLDETALIQAVEAVVTKPAAGRRASCGSSVLRQAAARWSELSPAARARLGTLMRRPDAPAGSPGAPAAPETGAAVHVIAHFRLHYRTSGADAVSPVDADRNRVPDYVERTGRYLEAAWGAAVKGLRYVAPTGERIDVYFREIPYNGLTHYEPEGAGWRPWIEVHRDVASAVRRNFGGDPDPTRVTRDPEGLEAGQLKGLAAHEFFHAIEARYQVNAPVWWEEGCADWMSGRVFPETGYAGQFVGAHLQRPDVSLFSDEGLMEYSASLFPRYLCEHGPGEDAIRRIWERLRSEPFEQALSAEVPQLREEFMRYACHNALRAYRDTWGMPEPTREVVRTYPASTVPAAGREPQYFGAHFIEMVPGTQPGTLALDLNSASPRRTEMRVIVVRSAMSWTILPGRSPSVRVPGFGGDVKRVLVVIGHFEPKATARYMLGSRIE
jgi:hypothetical protein